MLLIQPPEERFGNHCPNPDFVVHDPGESDNLAVIEVKPSTFSKKYAQNDINKLNKFINKINYQHGILLIFGSEGNVGRESAIGCYLYNLFIYATWGVAKWAKEVQSLDS